MRSGSRRWRKPLFLAGISLVLLVAGTVPGHAAHDMQNSCYVCHNIQGGTTWSGSNSIWTGRAIGMSSYSRPITCDVCHVDHQNLFTASVSNKSAHPVEIISADNMVSNFGYGTTVHCLDCHGGDTVSLSPNLAPDVTPASYTSNTGTDGYPNHDVASPNNDVLFGDPPHLGATYDNTPATSSADSDARYALCFTCHYTGSTKVSRATAKTVQSDYQSGGHYFKGSGNRIPCSDCHTSHRSDTSSRLMSPVLTLGSWPGVVYNDSANPDNASLRNMCVACHDQAAGTPTVRGVEPVAPPATVSAHPGSASPTTEACSFCHTPHNPRVSRDCLSCHTGTSPKARSGSYDYSYIDALFKGVGPDGVGRPTDASPLAWSQHGNSLSSTHYQAPYDGKSTNFCLKCHGELHNGSFKLIQADPSDSGGEAFTPVDNLSSATVSNANNFCLSCHDGDGGAADVQIGGVSPPAISRARWTAAGHGRESGSYATSNNSAASAKCVSCHEVHGSNHASLLPADDTAGGLFALPAAKPEMTFRSGALAASDLDFADYTDPAVAGAATFPDNWKSGKGFGTAGDPGNQYGASGATTGLCDACHRDDPSVNQTYNKAHTHMGIFDQGDPKSQMSFIRDCAECHDVHGGMGANLYMIADNVSLRPGTAQAAVRSVTFTALSGSGSFDDNTDSSGNAGDLCTVCHENSSESTNLNVGHNYFSSTADPDHKEGQNCLGCHPHGETDNVSQYGFPQGGACNSCHGWSDADGMPSYNDTNSNYHTDANNSLSTRGGSDNTAHKLHVDYLVSRRSVQRANACYVCHAGGGSSESHPENPTNTSFQLPSSQPEGQYVDVVLDNTGAVLNVGFGAGKPQPSYSGTVGQAAGQTYGWKTCSNTSCHFALSPSWSGKKQVSNYLAVENGPNRAYPPLVRYTKASQTDLAVDNFRMYTTTGSGNTTVSQIVVEGTNTANAAAGSVRIYRDAGVIGTFEPGTDVQVGAAVSFSGSTATFSSLAEVVGEAGFNYWVVVDTAASVTDGQTMTFRVSAVTASPVAASVSTTATSPGTGIDITLPTSSITTSGYVTAADPVTIAGTASDGGTNPSGLNRIEVTIQRTSDSQYWTGSGWGALTWLSATGTTSWTYSFSPAADHVLNLQSRAVDNAANTQSPVATGSVTLDRAQPTVASAVATDNTHVQVTFSEPVDKTSAESAAYYTITGGAGLSVSAAVRQDATDNAVVLLTTSSQTGGQSYTVTVDNVVPGVTDLAGNIVGTPNTANFSGYQANTLNVTNGASNPGGTLYVNGATTNSVMQQFRMAASSGTAAVSQIVVTKTGLAAVATSGAHIYRDVNNNGTYEGGTDTQVAGSPVTFSGDTATFAISPEESVDAAGANYLVAFDIDGGSADGAQVTSQVTGVTASYTVNNTSTASRAVSMDKTLPASSITTSGYITTSDPVTIAGTASDTAGSNPSGVNRVEVTIQRTSDSQYWTGSGWGALTWLAATGTTSWSYGFSPGADYTLNLQSRSVDNANNTQSPASTGTVTLDRVLPTVSSATATSATGVAVTFSEKVDSATANDASYYSTSPSLTISSATRRSAPDENILDLVTSSQTGGQSYTLTVKNTSPTVTDLAGNIVGTPNTANFTGFSSTPVLVDGKFQSAATQATNWPRTAFSTGSGSGTSAWDTTSATADGTGSLRTYETGSRQITSGTFTQSLGTTIPVGKTLTVGAMYRGNWTVTSSAGYTSLVITLRQSGGGSTYSYTAFNGSAQHATFQTWSDSTYTTTFEVGSVDVVVEVKTGNNASATAEILADDIYITYDGRPQFAPPRATGDSATYKAACDTCHQFGPRDDTLSSGTYGNPTTGTDMDQYFYDSPGDHIKHGVGDPQSWTSPAPGATDDGPPNHTYNCSVCHGNIATYTTDHADGMKDLRGDVGTTSTFTDDGTYDNGTKACSNVYCHGGRPTPVGGGGASWGDGSSTCGVCHAAPPPYGKHATHNKGYQGTGSTSPTNNSGASGYDFSCYYCHYTNSHVNFPANRAQRQDAQITFNGTLGLISLGTGSNYTPGGVTNAGWDNVANQGLSYSDGGCTVYCHSNADPSGTGGGAMTYASPKWVTGTGGSCTICHKGPDTYTNMSTGAPQMSRGHWMHLASNRYAFACDECHANTAAADSTNVLNTPTAYTYHVNGRKNWNGQDVKGGAGVRATAIDDSGMAYDNVTNRTCTASYCHSDGTDNTAPFAGAKVSPAWGTGTTSCTSCHNSDVASGTPMSTNAHGKHLTNSIKCAACHNATADNTSNTALNASTGYANHLNGTRNVVIDNTYDNTPANKTDDWTAGTSTCSNVKCHGGNPVVWTSTITNCSSCHSSTSADADDFVFGGFTGTVSNINSTEWTNTGHGRTSGTYPWPAPNTAANLGCMSSNATTPTGGCHTFSAGHDNASNFYRLAWSGTVDNASLRTFCNTCHSGTAPQVHSEGVTGYSGTNNWGASGGAREFVCASCHDVHGDASTNNPDFMVQTKVWAAGSSAGLIPATTGLGTEPDATNLTFDLSATPAGGDYVTDGGAVNKVCQVCHQGNAYWTRTSGTLTTHPNASPGRCTSCHQHDQGFKAACNACHGDIGGTIRGDSSAYPPEGPVAARTGGTQNWAETNSTGSTVGLHQRHVVTHGYTDCATCHTSTPGSGGTHNDDGANATLTNVTTYGSWNQGTSAGVTSVVDDYCSNISCHTGAADNAYSRYWEGQTLWDCFTCHGYKDQADATNNSQSFTRNMTTRAHPGHIQTLANGGAEKDCVNCHATGNTTLYSTTTPPGTHRSGGVDLDFTGAPKPYGAYTPAYAKGTGFAPGGASGTCSTAYCHSIVQKATGSGAALTNAAGEFKTPSWSGPVVCGDCHDDDPNTAGGTGVAMSTGSHTDHIGSSTYAIPCLACHTSAGDNTTLHVDGTIQVPIGNYTWRSAFTLTAAGTIYDMPGGGTTDAPNNTPGDGQYGTCSSVACHGDGRGGAPRVNPTWGGTDSDCTYCHGNDSTSAAAMGTNAHGKHLTSGIACRSCHYDTVSANRTISSTGYALHVNGTRNVVIDNTYDNTPANKTDDWTAGTSTCSNVKCHGGNPVVWTSTITNCSSCHSSTSADADDFVFGGFTGTVSNVNSTEWTSFGHAKASVSKGCMDCHSFSAGHDNASNFFRLDPVQFSGDLNGFCNNTGAGCHTGTTSFKTGSATNNIRNHTSADMTAAGGSPIYTWGFTPKCVDCHDPHGDGSNLHMIQSNLYDNGSTLAGVPNSSNRGGVPIAFTNDTLGMTTTPQSTYADNQAGFDSLCQECHNNNAIAFKDDALGNAGSHPSAPGNPGDCTGCHKHSEAFKPSGCNGCHGSTSTGQFWPDSQPSASYPDRAGKHQEHIDAIYNANSGTLPGATVTDKKNATCDWCHPNPGGSNHDTNTAGSQANTADVHRDPYNSGTHFKTISGAANGVSTESYDYANTAGGKDCSNVDCHYRVTTPTMGAAPDGWLNAAAVATCSNCHGSGTAGAALPNAHQDHVGSAPQKAYPCTYCHASGSYTVTHQDGQVSWSFAGTLDPGSTRTETYNGQATGTTTVKYGTGTFYACANVYCHIQSPSPAWNTSIASTNCTACHLTGQTAAPNPSSGLHYGTTAPTVSGTWHDNTLDATNKCAVCHTTLLSQSTHVDGTFQGGNGQKTQMGLFAEYAQTADGQGTCSGGAVIAAGCHDGAGEGAGWARKWNSAIHYATTGTECQGCHGGLGTNDWTFGQDNVTGDDNVSHGRNWDGDASAEVIGNHSGNTDQNNKCNTCHVYPDTPYGKNGNARIGWVGRAAPDNSTYHGNNQIEMNSTLGYSATNFNCTTHCHTNNTNHNLEDSGWTVNAIAGPAPSCDGCHKPGGSGPTVVYPSGNAPAGMSTSYGSHLRAANGDAIPPADWSAQCQKCHPFHSGGVTIPLPSTNFTDGVGTSGLNMQTILGITYTGNGGIHLGGTATTGSTEAEICWNCHYTQSISDNGEFGVNNNANTGGYAYNYGTLSTWNTTYKGSWWAGASPATWNSGQTSSPSFGYKSAAIQSMHSGNVSTVSPPNRPGTDAAGTIRCSYCHDVHDTNRSKRTISATDYGDNVTGQYGAPHLRGTWKGNPYKEDGAPQSGQSFTSANNYGPVPRGSNSTSQLMGGYWIDQNSGSPTSTFTVPNSAGLCVLCHSDNVNAMNQFNVNESGGGETVAQSWVSGYNGHRNAAVGGSGTSGLSGAELTARNIFRNSDRNPNGWGTTNSDSSRPLMSYINIGNRSDTSTRRFGFRSKRSDGWQFSPLISSDYAAATEVWNATIDDTTTQSKYHNFSCSKCHNPHASRLPRLMATNCLDTKHNTWDDTYQLASGTSSEGETIQTTDDSYNRRLSNWTSAQNCHRKGDTNPVDGGRAGGTGAGWNGVTPW